MEQIALYNAVKNYLESEKWHIQEHSDKNYIQCGVSLNGKLKSCRLIIQAKNNGIVCYAIIELNVGKQDRDKMAKFITLANYRLLNGNFEMDYSDGEVRYKTFLPAAVNVPDVKDIETCILIAPTMLDRYGDGLASLIMGYGDPEELIKQIEE